MVGEADSFDAALAETARAARIVTAVDPKPSAHRIRGIALWSRGADVRDTRRSGDPGAEFHLPDDDPVAVRAVKRRARGYAVGRRSTPPRWSAPSRAAWGGGSGLRSPAAPQSCCVTVSR